MTIVNPLSTMKITSNFGSRNSFTNTNGTTASTNHLGVDLSAAIGTGAIASENGTVIEVNRSNTGYGNSIKIKTESGYTLLYAHLQNVGVSVGQKVSAGETIATTGATGNVTGPHLHFGVYDATGKAVDPITWLKNSVNNSSDPNSNSGTTSNNSNIIKAIALISAALLLLKGEE